MLEALSVSGLTLVMIAEEVTGIAFYFFCFIHIENVLFNVCLFL